MSVEAVRRRFTVAEYHSMSQAGILLEDDRVELLEGEIVQMSPVGRRHAACVKRLNRMLSDLVGREAIVSVQDPVRVGMDSEPQPDLALLRWRPDFYAGALPEAGDVQLVVEVAESSGHTERLVKVPLYARGGVPEVWLVDLVGDAVEVHRRPGADGYEEVQRVGRGEHLSPQHLPALDVGVSEILGPEEPGD